MKYDYVIVGAGLSGLTIANILANKNKKVLVIEKRSHIGGNCYDYYEKGILVHKYGPHIFHTDNIRVWDYLSQFTEWNDYKHKVKVEVDGKLVTLPINLNSIVDLFNGVSIAYFINSCVNYSDISIYDLLNSDNSILKELGNYLYKKIYENYTIKQWGLKPEQIDRSILDRIKIRNTVNDNYFLDKYQGLPINGYTEMFNNMIINKNIEVKLNIDCTVLENYENVIYTGRLDELFDYCYDELPYRSLDFVFNFYNSCYYQECGVINYPQHEVITRNTEYKYLTQQKNDSTIVVSEYPKECTKNDIPYYPILNDENISIYNKYKKLADSITNLHLLGRLAEYKYYDMDKAVLSALELGDKL